MPCSWQTPGVEHDRLVAGACAFQSPKLVEHIGLARLDLGHLIPLRICAYSRHAVSGNVDGFDTFTPRRQPQRKSPL